MAQLCDLPDDVLKHILAGSGGRGIASSGTSCSRLAGLQGTLASLPIFASALSTLPVLEAAISEAADRALAGMLGPVDFAVIVVCNYSAPQKYARGKGMRHAVSLLLNHLQMDIPCIGCIGQGCMGVDPTGEPCEVDPADRTKGVSLLLGRLPGCRISAFAAEDGPSDDDTWPAVRAAWGSAPPEMLLLLANNSEAADTSLPDVLKWLNQHLPATTPVAGGFASGKALLFNPGGTAGSSTAGKALRSTSPSHAQYVGLAFSSASSSSSSSSSGGSGSSAMDAEGTAAAASSCAGAAEEPSSGIQQPQVLTAAAGVASMAIVEASHAGTSTAAHAAADGLTLRTATTSQPSAPGQGCTLAASALSVKAMAPAAESHIYQVAVEDEYLVTVAGFRVCKVAAAGPLGPDGKLSDQGMTEQGAVNMMADSIEASSLGGPHTDTVLWRTRQERPRMPLDRSRHRGEKAVSVYFLPTDMEYDNGSSQVLLVTVRPEDEDLLQTILMDRSAGRLCIQDKALSGEANVRALEEQLPALRDAVSTHDGSQDVSADYYAAAARSAAAAGARSGPLALMAFSCVTRGKALYESWGAEAKDGQEAHLMDTAMAGRAPFWGMYVGGELGPQPRGSASCGFAGKPNGAGGDEAGPVSNLAFSSVFAVLGAASK